MGLECGWTISHEYQWPKIQKSKETIEGVQSKYNVQNTGPSELPSSNLRVLENLLGLKWRISQYSPHLGSVRLQCLSPGYIMSTLWHTLHIHKRAVLVSSLNGVEDVLQPNMFVLFIGILSEKCVYIKKWRTQIGKILCIRALAAFFKQTAAYIAIHKYILHACKMSSIYLHYTLLFIMFGLHAVNGVE